MEMKGFTSAFPCKIEAVAQTENQQQKSNKCDREIISIMEISGGFSKIKQDKKTGGRKSLIKPNGFERFKTFKNAFFYL